MKTERQRSHTTNRRGWHFAVTLVCFCSVSEHLPPAIPRPGDSHFQHPTPASLARRQPFPAELATLPHRPWAPKPSEPSISGFSSTKLPFLCAFVVRNPHFQAFRAQNRHFCALLPFGTAIFGPLEHKIGVFVLGKSNRGEGVKRKGRVIAERAKGSRNLRDAYGAQYSKKFIFCCLFRLFSNFASSFGSRQRD